MNESKAQFVFHVGQKVLCVESGKTIDMKYHVYEDLTYTISSCETFNGVPMVRLTSMPRAQWCASRFAPYDPPRLEIPAELLEVTEERIDCKPEVKEVV